VLNPSDNPCIICACEFKVDSAATGIAKTICLKFRKLIKPKGISIVEIISNNIKAYQQELEIADANDTYVDVELIDRKIKWLKFTVEGFKQNEKLSPRYKPHHETCRPVLAGYLCPCGSLNKKKFCVACESNFQVKLQAFAKTFQY
jgi:hypothetical protein